MRLKTLILLQALTIAPATALALIDGEDDFLHGHYEKALAPIRTQAEQGNARAQSYLGEYYRDGLAGIKKDPVISLQWIEKSAQKNDCNGLDDLAGTQNNDSEKRRLYTKAKSICLKADEPLQLDPMGLADLSDIFAYFGDYASAFSYEYKSAAWGYHGAQLSLGNMYSEGTGTAKNSEKAFEWWQKSAVQGNAAAQLAIGNAYEQGDGVAQDYDKALFWFKKSAEQGFVYAQKALGIKYFNGKGVEQNFAESAKWYGLAADQGDPMALGNLAYHYYAGKGVPQNYAKAAKLYEKAAILGNPRAQYFMGLIYFEGKGVIPNYTAAYVWDAICAANETKDDDFTDYCVKNRGAVEKQMSAEQVSRAQDLASKWHIGETIRY